MARYRSFGNPDVHLNIDLILKITVRDNQLMPGEGLHAVSGEFRCLIEAHFLGGETLLLANFPSGTDRLIIEAKLQELLVQLT
ncbi:hypothetical protein [Deinococcus roseus]|uniref:Uncharacterized protein n=1 Tax=Deinococcus roseus TaxID=392414 RepID=A0ABQ2CZ13_9DEIO|nr:hypothetical protein [Deinococcus roseus]GGJ34715.1 hypothetical protein GCM10008938_21140 [Deinococcus roseus]